MGYGWEYMISGVAMGILYDIGWRIPSKWEGFEQGTPLGIAASVDVF